MQKHLWDPLFRHHVPAFYLRVNNRLYQPLDPANPTIRLLQLLPGNPSDSIECRLIETNVHEADFEAVSYAWGGHLVLRRHILVNRKSFWITQNIFQALRSLRQLDRPRTLWIDQICINQRDAKEKTDQVTHKMHHVYRNAQRVIVWLGAATPDISWAFEQAKLYPGIRYDEASGYKIRKGERESDEARRYIDAWMNIFWRKWFRRVWVVQEGALARHMLVRCGTAEMEWNTLTRTALDLKRVHNVSTSPHVKALMDFFDRTGRESRSISLLDLAIRFRKNETTDPRDKLIGFLALADDGRQYPDIHYHYQARAVFANYTASYIMRTQSLAILALAEVRNDPILDTSPCTWALDWGMKEIFEDPPPILWGEGLQSSAISRTARYRACANRPSICRREPGQSTEQSLRGIFLQGWHVDTVKVVSTVGSRWDIPTTLPIWDEFARHQLPNTKGLKVMFESLVLADIYDLQQNTSWSEWYVPQYNKKKKAADDDDNLVKQASRIMEDLCHRRRFFITMNGKLGIGPSATCIGDHVCILAGSAAPCLIRKWRNAMRLFSAGHLSDNRFDHTKPHHLVGQVVLSGIMYTTESNIQERIEVGTIQPRDIWLR